MVPFQDLKRYLETGEKYLNFPSFEGYTLSKALSDSREYLRIVEKTAKTEMVDLKTATEIFDRIEKLVPYLETRKNAGEIYSFFLVVYYYIQVEDDENDLNSPVGFDDDAEIMNLFLKTLDFPFPAISFTD